MKFGISNVFVLCAVLLSVETFAAPLQIIDARDESTLAIRAIKKTPVGAAKPVLKKPAVVAAPKKPAVVAAPKKPAVVAAPKKAPVAAAPKKAPVATAPKKAPVATAPKKAPVAAAPKKAPVTAAPKKAPLSAAPKKAPVATASKKASVTAAPKKTPAPAASKKVATKSATSTTKSSSTVPKPTVSSCSFRSNVKPAKPKTIKGRVVATTQFHATCKNFAASIKAQVQAGTFKLQPERLWPNELTWSGGFYVTPDEDKAQLFGATFLADKCATQGGVVVMKFSLNQSALKVQEVPQAQADAFRTRHSKLGGGIQRFLKKQAAADTTAADPPADENISKDDNPAVQPPLIALPTEAQLKLIIEAGPTGESINKVKKLQAELLQALVDFQTVDVVAGAPRLMNSQQVAIADAGSPEVKIPALTEPFNQVVLVTDKAMKALTFVSQEDLPKCLADKQPLLVAFLKKKAAAA